MIKVKTGENIDQNLKEAFLQGDRQAIVALGVVFLKENKLNLSQFGGRRKLLEGQPIYYSNKWGMASEDAIRCLFDLERTSAFVRGIKNAVDQAKETHPGEIIRTIEPGGGTGILSIAAALAGAEVTMVEINDETAKKAQKFVDALNLTNKVKIIVGDATTYMPENGTKFDLIISENMHTGLAREPQVQIARNLNQYLKEDGVVIPQGVNLRFALAKIGWNGDEYHTEFRNVEQSIRQLGSWTLCPFVDFSKISEDNPEDLLRLIVGIPDGFEADGIVVQMDTVIDEKIILNSGRANFLGHDHALRLEKPVSREDGSHVFLFYPTGGEFPREVYPFTP